MAVPSEFGALGASLPLHSFLAFSTVFGSDRIGPACKEGAPPAPAGPGGGADGGAAAGLVGPLVCKGGRLAGTRIPKSGEGHM